MEVRSVPLLTFTRGETDLDSDPFERQGSPLQPIAARGR